MTPEVVLYSRHRCPLCEQAKEAMYGAGIRFREIDISADRHLEQEYGTRVPVVEVDGRFVFDGGMDPQSLAELIAEAEETLA